MTYVECRFPKTICALSLTASFVMVTAAFHELGATWKVILAAAISMTSIIHAIALDKGRPSEVLQHFRMLQVAIAVICMSTLIPAPGYAFTEVLPSIALFPIVILATIRQGIGRQASLVSFATSSQ